MKMEVQNSFPEVKSKERCFLTLKFKIMDDLPGCLATLFGIALVVVGILLTIATFKTVFSFL